MSGRNVLDPRKHTYVPMRTYMYAHTYMPVHFLYIHVHAYMYIHTCSIQYIYMRMSKCWSLTFADINQHPVGSGTCMPSLMKQPQTDLLSKCKLSFVLKLKKNLRLIVERPPP